MDKGPTYETPNPSNTTPTKNHDNNIIATYLPSLAKPLTNTFPTISTEVAKMTHPTSVNWEANGFPSLQASGEVALPADNDDVQANDPPKEKYRASKEPPKGKCTDVPLDPPLTNHESECGDILPPPN